MMEPKYCIVCGAGSHRDDWASKDAPFCDTHTKAEVDAALVKFTAKTSSKAIPTKPPAPTEQSAS
jgi:hypothetical protein